MTKRLQAAAKDIAGKGRYGDDRLLHVSQTEIDGLASLIPGGKLPINPDTGLPEAFFFLPFLAGLGAMAAPAAAAAVPAAAGAIGTGLAAGAAGAGLTAATALPAVAGAAGAAGAGLGAIAPTAATAAGAGLAAAPTAISAAAPLAGEAAALAAPTAASALPATAELAAPLTAGTSTLAGAPAGALSSVPSLTPEVGFIGGPAAPLNPMVATAEALPGDLAAGIGPSPMAAGAIPEAAAMPATTSSIPTSTASVFPAAPSEGSGIMAGMESVGATPEMAGGLAEGASEAGGGLFSSLKGGIGGILGNMDAQKMMQLAGVASMLKGKGGGKKKKSEKKDISGVKYEGGEPNRPSDDYRPGIDPEFRYFNNFHMGGMVPGYAEGGMLTQFKPMAASTGIASLPNYSVPNAQMPAGPAPAAIAPAPSSNMALFGTDTPGQSTISKPSNIGELFYMKFKKQREHDAMGGGRKAGGLIKGYAEGGIASLMPPEQVPMQPEGDTPKPQTGEDDAALIEATVKAVQGEIPDPQAGQIIQTFVDTFGEEALQDLMAKVQGMGQTQAPAAPATSGGIPTMGDGMSDSVPATISGPGGQQPAALSEGEFVVPADVVSGLGNGSTDAGAQQLHGMMDKVRTMRGGGAVQPPAIDPRMAMPL